MTPAVVDSVNSLMKATNHPANAYTDIQDGQPYVEIDGRAVSYPRAPELAGWKHGCGYVTDPSGVDHPIVKFTLSKRDRYQLSRGTAVLETLRQEAEGVEEDRPRGPIRDIEERLPRVLDTYTFHQTGAYTWDAVEDTGDVHKIETMMIGYGPVAVSCDCEAFSFYTNEPCVHCVAWTREDGTYMTNEMVKAVPAQLATQRELTAPFRQIVNETYFKGNATDEVLDLVSAVCDRYKLDLFAGQIYVIERRFQDKGEWKSTWHIMPSIHGYLAIAERDGQFDGISDKQWCGPDGKWVDLWLQSYPPTAAKISVWRKGINRPFVGTVLWKSFCQTRDGKPTSLWASHGPEQLMKCALSQALRQAFPNVTAYRHSENDPGNTITVSSAATGGETEHVVVGDDETYDATVEPAKPAAAQSESVFAPSPDELKAFDEARAELISLLKPRQDKNEWAKELINRGGGSAKGWYSSPRPGWVSADLRKLIDDIRKVDAEANARAESERLAAEAASTVTDDDNDDPFAHDAQGLSDHIEAKARHVN